VNVKEGDQYPAEFTVNMDLTGATTRLLVRHLTRTGDLEELDHDVTDAEAGTFTHDLDGTWAIGTHYLELEITRAGEVRTAPTDGFLIIRVTPDLD
jgi:hypothetical protein